MCGIGGVARFERQADKQRQVVETLCAEIAHRGPDGGGVAPHLDATLGMRRLAIVDVAGGQQPMFNHDQSVALVFNGEIYNAPALRAQLVREGVVFRTRSDTEVVLRLFEKNPDDVERHLAGMWAFAIHDRKKKRLVLSRDRFGIKPLFLAEAGGALAFASELRCFKVLHGDPRFAPLFHIDPGAAAAVAAWGYVPQTSTIYSGVKRLEPGHRLSVDLASGARALSAYWRLIPSLEAGAVTTLDEACALVEPVLRRAVTEHLESDVPLAAFLSGGIDSSLVAAYASEDGRRKPTAFSAGFEDARFDESPHARETARKLGLGHEVLVLNERAAQQAVPDALLAYDEPFGDSSSIATLLLSRLVAGTHKVALAGDGGDEAFAGYRKHNALRVRRWVGRVPGALPVVAGLLGRLPTTADRSTRRSEVLRSLGRLKVGLDTDDGRAWAALSQVVSLDRVAPLVPGGGEAARFLEEARAGFALLKGSLLQRTLEADLGSPLANDMLTKVDRASMAVSLEVRVPFLDHRVVEVGLGLPEQFTLGPPGKRVLRALHRRRFGDQLAGRRKQGFGVPVEAWMRGPLAPALDALFSREALEPFAFLASTELADGAWRRWSEKDPQVLWHLVALVAWLEANHGQGAERVREAFALADAGSADSGGRAGGRDFKQ